MLSWLKNLFGAKPDAAPVQGAPPPKEKAEPVPEETREAAPLAQGEPEAFDGWRLRPLKKEDADFLTGLLAGGDHTDLQSFSLSDRSFLSALMRKTHSGDLSIPLLPEAAINIRKLMGSPDVPVSRYVEVFKNDPALTAEILKVANSPYYGFENPTHDLGQAVVRIGYSQMRAIVMMMSMRSKILHSGQYGLESDLIVNLALATARSSCDLASSLGIGEEEAFTRGLLSHLDFLIILSVAAEFNASNKGIRVSRQAMREASVRLAAEIMRLVAKKWGLENLGYGSPSSPETGESEMQRIRRTVGQIAAALVEVWAGGEPSGDIEGIPAEKIKSVVMKYVGNRA